MEFTLTKRASQRWMGQISYFAVKNHRWLDSVFQNANEEFFPLDETWSWAGNISATYRLPYDVSVSGFLQSKSGVKGQRTNIFRTADPMAVRRSPTTATRRFASSRTRSQSFRLQHSQLPGEQGFPHDWWPEVFHRFRYVQRVEFRHADRRRFRVGADVRLCHRRHAAAHYAHRRAVHVLAGRS